MDHHVRKGKEKIEKVVRWVPPAQGTVKLNFDGGGGRGRAVSGGIFRDHEGLPLFSYACSEVGPTSSPYVGEAQALAKGLIYAWDMGFSRLWVEGDAMYLVDAVEGRRKNKWYAKETVELIRSWMDAFPERPALVWIPREGNSAADALVKHVREGVSSTVVGEMWWSKGVGLPETVAAVVDRERNGFEYIRRRRPFQQQQQQHNSQQQR